MEAKQLNFDQPLLSVRRFSFGPTLENQSKRKRDKSSNIPEPPPFRSELKSGPVTNPGSVPFYWETTPGRPKDETRPQTQTVEKSPTAPKLPPGRTLKANAEGPFVNKDQLGSISHGSRNVQPLDEDVRRIPSLEDMEELENSSSGNSDEAYVDALDTLSRNESLFFNCSESGLSGLDDPNEKIDGSSSRDPQTREFMMGRFLPAAKAMASGTPQHVPWKPPIIREQPRQVKTEISVDKQPQLRYMPSFVSDFTKCHDSGDEESDDDPDEQQNHPARACGLLPRLGLKGSLCLLNPLLGTSMRTREHITPLSKTQSTPFSGCRELEHERYQLNTNGQRSVGGIQKIKPEANNKDLKTDNSISYGRHRGKPEGISSYRHMVVGGVSSERNGSQQSYEPKAAPSILGPPKNLEATGKLDNNTLQSYLELLDDQSKTEELDRRIPLVEKTLYIDTIHKVKYLDLESSSFNRKRRSGSEGEQREILPACIKRYPSLDSSFDFDEKLSIADKAAMTQHDIQKPIDFLKLTLSDKVNQDTSKASLKSFGQNQDLHKGALILANLKRPVSKTHHKALPEAEKSENYSEFPIPPPLPKSPSDSWLGRTLPTMSAKNAPRHAYLGTVTASQYNESKPKASAPKWETIFKTTSQQNQHLRFSEEWMTSIPET